MVVYDAVYDRIHTMYAPYTTVFRRNTCDRITIVSVRDRIRPDTAKYGDRIRRVYAMYTVVYDSKRPYSVSYTVACLIKVPKFDMICEVNQSSDYTIIKRLNEHLFLIFVFGLYK